MAEEINKELTEPIIIKISQGEHITISSDGLNKITTKLSIEMKIEPFTDSGKQEQVRQELAPDVRTHAHLNGYLPDDITPLSEIESDTS